jgi:hypothetical protein
VFALDLPSLQNEFAVFTARHTHATDEIDHERQSRTEVYQKVQAGSVVMRNASVQHDSTRVRKERMATHGLTFAEFLRGRRSIAKALWICEAAVAEFPPGLKTLDAVGSHARCQHLGRGLPVSVLSAFVIQARLALCAQGIWAYAPSARGSNGSSLTGRWWWRRRRRRRRCLAYSADKHFAASSVRPGI